MSKKTTASANTGLSVSGQFSLEQVPDLLQQINDKIKELQGDKDRAAKINEPLGPFGRVSDIKEPSKLMDAYAFISRKAAAHDEFKPVFQAIDPLSPVKAFTESGHTVKQWQDEIIAQYRETTFESKLAKLKEAKKMLEENLSAEQKFVASMQNIKDLFTA